MFICDQEYNPRRPSWFPDFAEQGPALLRPLTFIPGHSADDIRKSSENHARFSIDEDELSVYGTAVETVAKAGGSGHALLEKGRWEGCAKLMLDSDEIYPFTGQDRAEMLWKTLICDVNGSGRSPAPTEFGMAFRAFAASLISKGLVLAEESGISREEHTETINAVDELTESDAKRLGVMPRFKHLMETEGRDRKLNRRLGLFLGTVAAMACRKKDVALRAMYTYAQARSLPYRR